jgi:hypothetical protein
VPVERLQKLLEVPRNNGSSGLNVPRGLSWGKLTFWCELRDDARQLAAFLRHPDSPRQVFHGLWPKGLVELTGLCACCAGANPRLMMSSNPPAGASPLVSRARFGRAKAPWSGPTSTATASLTVNIHPKHFNPSGLTIRLRCVNAPTGRDLMRPLAPSSFERFPPQRGPCSAGTSSGCLGKYPSRMLAACRHD